MWWRMALPIIPTEIPTYRIILRIILTAITNEMSAVTNVVAEFSKQINTGLADESVLDDYRAKLETSGIQKIIDEYQRQLDAWIEANK